MVGMSAPGWYPDPSGQGQYRYWDGRAWTSQVTGGAAGPASPPGSRKPWLWFALAMVVVGVLVVVLVWKPAQLLGAAPEDQNSARPTGSQWNEQEPTNTPTVPEDTGKGQIIDCPQNSLDARSTIDSDGRMRGGGLSFVARRDWRAENVFMPWLYDHNSQIKTIAPGWMSNISVGLVKTSEGFTGTRQSAESLMSCMASSDLYIGFTGREDFRNQEYTLDGRSGWRITANVYVDNQGAIKGDVVDIIVLDTGRADGFSVFISCATIDDRTNLDEVAAATDSLRVE